MNIKTTLMTIATLAVVIFSVDSSFLNSSARDLNQTKESDRDQRNENTALYMQAKLSNAEKILSGLVSENFTEIESAAIQLKKISTAAHWPTTIDEVYQHHGFEFRRQCDKLVEQARLKNLRGAHFTYLHMTTTCIDCHEYVRPRFRVQRKPKGPIQLIPSDWKGRAKRMSKPEPDDGDSSTDPTT